MPKIIKDVKETIKLIATELFIEYGYENIDMRMISKKSKVAVGTLYNYYKNKKELYISIIKESWTNTFTKLDDITKLNISSEEKLKKFISILYDDIEERNGLGKDLLNNSIVEFKNDEEIINLRSNLFLKVESFLNHFDKVDTISKCSNVDTKLAELLLIYTLAMFQLHPDDKEENINFLFKFIKLSIK